MAYHYYIMCVSLIFALSCKAPDKLMSQSNTLAEKLGYKSDAKLLIMHADDLGVAQGVNQASIKALESSAVSSASIMVPCPWFGDLAAYASQHPEYCWGIHLTLTAEWKYYKWGGVLPATEIPSLINEDGFMYDNVQDVIAHANLEEVEKELRAQIDRALDSGITLSHLDSHMGTLFSTPALFKLYVKLGNQYQLPVMIMGPVVPPSWNLQEYIGPIHAPLDHLQMLSDFPISWDAFYNEKLSQVKPGLNEIIVHLGYDNEEMQAIMIDHPAFGASWRQKDFDYVMSDGFKEKLNEYDIHLVSYREIRAALLAEVKGH